MTTVKLADVVPWYMALEAAPDRAAVVWACESHRCVDGCRLLAREGIDADRLTQDLRSFELKTTFEDVFPVDAASVEEYLQHVHEMTVLAAIQEAQQEGHSSFDDFMFQASQVQKQE